MTSDLDMTYRKMSDFVSFPMLGFTLVVKKETSILKVIEIL